MWSLCLYTMTENSAPQCVFELIFECWHICCWLLTRSYMPSAWQSTLFFSVHSIYTLMKDFSVVTLFVHNWWLKILHHSVFLSWFLSVRHIWVQALIPALLMNVYIVGLNQIYDIDIDKVNKPYLPLASGEFSVTTGITLVTICAALVRVPTSNSAY